MTDSTTVTKHSEGAIRAAKEVAKLINNETEGTAIREGSMETAIDRFAEIIDRETNASELERVKEVNRILTKGLQVMTHMGASDGSSWSNYATKVLEEANAPSLANNNLKQEQEQENNDG